MSWPGITPYFSVQLARIDIDARITRHSGCAELARNSDRNSSAVGMAHDPLCGFREYMQSKQSARLGQRGAGGDGSDWHRRGCGVCITSRTA